MNSVVAEDLKQIVSSIPSVFDELAGKTVLVSGANGFLPAYLIEAILYANSSVTGGMRRPTRILALVRNEDKARARFHAYAGRADLKLIVQDVCQPLSLDGSVDYIIHAASQASPKYFGVDPVGTLGANVLGTHQLLTLAKEKGSKGFLFFSSAEIYGSVPASEMPISEKHLGPLDPMQVRSCYGESKRMGETMCVSWWHQYGIPVKVVRPFHTYGPGLALDDGRVFSDFVADILHSRDIVMKSTGEALRAYCYLADAVEAFLLVLTQGRAGEAYNVGNPDAEISVLGLAEKLAGLFPEKGLKVVPLPRKDGDVYLASAVNRIAPDISKIRELGWSPRHGIEAGFSKTVRSFT